MNKQVAGDDESVGRDWLVEEMVEACSIAVERLIDVVTRDASPFRFAIEVGRIRRLAGLIVDESLDTELYSHLAALYDGIRSMAGSEDEAVAIIARSLELSRVVIDDLPAENAAGGALSAFCSQRSTPMLADEVDDTYNRWLALVRNLLVTIAFFAGISLAAHEPENLGARSAGAVQFNGQNH